MGYRKSGALSISNWFIYQPEQMGSLRIDMDIFQFGALCIASWDIKYLLLDNDDSKSVGEFETFGGIGRGKNTLEVFPNHTYNVKVTVRVKGECDEKNLGFALQFKPTFIPKTE
jgi:hypothetical protein